MSSATLDVTYTSVYTDSEPGRAFWGAAYEEISEGGIPRVIVLGYDGLPLQPVAPPSPDFVLGHMDPDYVLEPYYPEYIPLEDDHVAFGIRVEQPLPLRDYPMDGGDDGDDDDGDSSRDDARDEDKDEEDKKDKEDQEHLAPADSTTIIPADEPVFPPEGTEPIIPPPSTDITIGARITIRPQTSISLPPEAEVERLLAMTTPSPSPPISLSPPSAGERLARCTAPPAHSPPLPPSSGCLTQIQTLRIASTQALIDAVTAALPPPSLPPLPPSLSIPAPVDRRDDIPESEQPPRKRLHLSTIYSRYEIGESSTARPARGQGIDYGFVSTVDAEERRQGIRDVGYGIRDTWVDPAEAVPEIAPMTVGEVNTRVVELAELHERDTQDLYALLEDAQDGDRMDVEGEEHMLPERLRLFDRIEPGDSSGASDTIVIMWNAHETYLQKAQPDTATAAEYSHSDNTQHQTNHGNSTTSGGPNTPINHTNPNNRPRKSIQVNERQALFGNATNGMEVTGLKEWSGLTRWIEKKWNQFSISVVGRENTVKFATLQSV
ncbi:hypothetical protein Tco_1136226 [Tanacetum coccineum]